MKTYAVSVPIAGVAYVEVEAESAEAAIDAALGLVTKDDIEEWNPLRHMTKGNVNYFHDNDASAEEV